MPYLVEGKEGFLIDKCVADLFGYAVGDRVDVTFTTFAPYFEALSIETLSFEVTGLMHSIEGVNIFETSPVFLTSDYFYDTVTEIEGAKELVELIGMEKDDFVRLRRIRFSSSAGTPILQKRASTAISMQKRRTICSLPSIGRRRNRLWFWTTRRSNRSI